MRKRLGFLLDDWATGMLDYIERHKMEFWVLGMLLTASFAVMAYLHNPTEFHSIKMVILLLIAIPAIGWIWFMVYFIPVAVLAVLSKIMLEPVKMLTYALKFFLILIIMAAIFYALAVLL